MLLFGNHLLDRAHLFIFASFIQIKLFATLMREIADEGNDQAGRQMACIIAKNLVSVRQTVSTKYITNDFV